MALFNRRESRSVSYQQVWGSGGDWQKALGHVGLLGAVAIPVVYRSLSVLAGMVAQMDPRCFSGKGVARVEVDDLPLVANPSNTLTPYEWRFAGTVSLALAGEQTGLILGRDAADYPTTVEWVWPERLTHHDRGIGLRPDWSLDGTPIDRSMVWHRRNFVMPGQVRGVDPLSKSGLTEVANLARKFGRDWFERGAIPSGILETEADPGQDGAERLLEKWKAATRGRKPVVMPKGTTFTQVSVAAEESQFLATVADAEASIAVALGVPGEWVGRVASGSTVTYANRDQRLQDLQVATLNHYITVWNEALTASSRPGTYVRLNPAVVLRSDLASRMAAYGVSAEIEAKTGIRVYTEDEIRDLEERLPLPERTTPYSGQVLPPVTQGRS